MATVAAAPAGASIEQRERRFHFIMALVMATATMAGFAFNFAMGRSSFAVPAVVHIHAAVFIAWLALYVAQTGLIAADNRVLHKRVGITAFALVPVMVAVGLTMSVSSMRRTGGPFFFDQREFLISNSMLLLLFAAFVFWALRARRYSGWHRRLLFVAMAILTGPGLGRLLPMPLFIPHAWTVSFLSTLIWPGIAMIADKRRHGRVHPALIWGTAIYVAVFVVSLLIAATAPAHALTEWVLEGSPGADRPREAFLPPGFAI